MTPGVPLISPFAKLKVCVTRLRVDSGLFSLRAPYVKIRLGHRRKKTDPYAHPIPFGPKSPSKFANPKSLKTPESFEFRVTLHEHLFWTLQIDVMDSKRLISDAHIGRLEIRLSKLNPDGQVRLSWHELLPKTVNGALVDLNIMPKPTNRAIGALELSLEYVKSGTKSRDLERQVMEERVVRRQSISKSRAEELDRTDFQPQPAQAIARLEKIAEGEPRVVPSANDDIIRQVERTNPEVRALEAEAQDAVIRQEEVEQDILDDSRPVNDLVDKLYSLLLNKEDVEAIRCIRAILAGFGQGIEASNYSLSLAFVLVQRYWASIPKTFENLCLLTHSDLELPRVMYRYTMASLGWRGLNFFGRGGGLIIDVARPDADKRSVMEYLHLAEPDLLVFQLDTDYLYRPNFFVAIDRRLSAIILSIRGTMSMRDTLTDLVCEYVPWGTTGGLVHSGILEAAKWFDTNVVPMMLRWATEYNVSNIYLVGHSLGGASSALTTVLLMEKLSKEPSLWPTYRYVDGTSKACNIHCFSYGTPPIVTPELAKEEYKGVIDVYVNGNDVIPRLSYGSISDLRLLIVWAAHLVHTKHILWSSSSELAKLYTSLEKCRRTIVNSGTHPKLTQPGTIHHLQAIPSPGGQQCRMIETLPDALNRFMEIELRTGSMFLHHMPDKYEQALEEAYQSLSLKNSFDAYRAESGILERRGGTSK